MVPVRRSHHGHRSRRRPARPGAAVALLLASTLAMGCAVLLLVGWTAGWRAETMTTASMGTNAPVGTLVIVRPVASDSIHVGEIIAFHPPGQPTTTFVHRVVGVHGPADARTFSTRGDLSGSVDPWMVQSSGVLGRAAITVRAAGWLLRMLPWMTVGALSVLAFSLPLPSAARRSFRILGLTLVTIAAFWHFKPLVGVEYVSGGATAHGGQASVVPTGVLPVTVKAMRHAAGSVHLGPGQLGTVHATALTSKGELPLAAVPHLTGWWWLVAVTWAVPLFAALRRTD